MERELWKLIVAALKRLPRTRPRNAVYTDSEVLAVLLWAVLHDRPISWACARRHWPPQAWRRRLPDQSTMSRRMRTDATRDQLALVLTHVQASLPHGRLLFTDGKAFSVSDFTSDPDAANGWGTGHMARGYRLHVVIDDAGRVLGWDALPMDKAEMECSRRLVEQMPSPRLHMRWCSRMCRRRSRTGGCSSPTARRSRCPISPLIRTRRTAGGRGIWPAAIGCMW